MMIEEPKFSNEAELESALTAEVKRVLDEADRAGRISEYFLLPHFGLDIAVFIRNNRMPYARFLEVKAYTMQRPGSIPFGAGKRGHTQVDLLCRPDISPALSDSFIRWVVGDATQVFGSFRFALVGNEAARQAARGGAAIGKHNNFNVMRLMETPLAWSDLCSKIADFLLVDAQ